MWRGLMLTKAVEQFLRDVHWGDLDYLLIDMPPGTGDVQMGLARLLPRTDLVIVTTPALAAQKVAQRAADMARRSFLRVVGVIENMSSFTCDDGNVYELFGSGGGRALADAIGAPLLGQVPLEPAVSAGGDAGTPISIDGDSVAADVFRAIAARIVGRDRSAVVRRQPSTWRAARRACSTPSRSPSVRSADGEASYAAGEPAARSASIRSIARRRVGMVADLGGDPFGGAAVLGVIEQRADRLSDRRNRHLIPPELAACASRNHVVRVGVLVGSLGDHEERQTVGERTERRSCPSVGDGRVATPEQEWPVVRTGGPRRCRAGARGRPDRSGVRR